MEELKGDATVLQNNKLYRELFSLYTTTDVLNDPRRRRELVEFVRALIVVSRKTREAPPQVIPLVARMIKQPEEKVARSWKFHAFPAALPDDTLNLMTEEERWIAKSQSPQKEPRTREQLAALIDTSVLKRGPEARGTLTLDSRPSRPTLIHLGRRWISEIPIPPCS